MDFDKALAHLWPKADQAVLEGIIKVKDKAFAEFGIDTDLVVAHFMAQVSHECGAGQIKRENMNYSAHHILEIFGEISSAKVTAEEALGLANKPELLAERVYGLGNPKKAKELGNTQHGDGYRYRGNGMLQLTGRGSHASIGKRIGFDLERDPTLMSNPSVSFLAAVAEFCALGADKEARADNVVLCTRRVNGGKNGLAERQVWLRKWKEALDGVETPTKAPRASDVGAAPTLTSTNTSKGVIATGTVTTVATITQAVQFFQSTTEQVKDVADNTTHVVSAVKPLLGVSPIVIQQGLIALGVFVLIGLGYILYQRHKRLNETGV